MTTRGISLQQYFNVLEILQPMEKYITHCNPDELKIFKYGDYFSFTKR